MTAKFRDTISGAILLIVAAGYFAGSFAIKQYGDAAVDSRFFPQILGAALAVLSLAQIFQALKGAGAPPPAAQTGEEASHFNRGVLITLGIILAYILLLDVLGFIVSSVAYLVAQTLLLTPREKRRPLVTLAVSAVFSAVVYAIFVLGFHLTLPNGIFA